VIETNVIIKSDPGREVFNFVISFLVFPAKRADTGALRLLPDHGYMQTIQEFNLV